MYRVYKFYIYFVGPIPAENQANVWVLYSEHTQLRDAQDSLQRALDRGENLTELKLVFE